MASTDTGSAGGTSCDIIHRRPLRSPLTLCRWDHDWMLRASLPALGGAQVSADPVSVGPRLEAKADQISPRVVIADLP
jgi:hypothetical protein